MSRPTAAAMAGLDAGVLRHDAGPYTPENYLDAAGLAAWNDVARMWLRIKRKSAKTLDGYGGALAQFAASLPAGRGVLEATRNDVEDYLAHIGATRSPASQAARQRALSAWFTLAVHRGHLAASPLAGVSYPKVQDVPPRVLDRAEIGALIKATAGATRDGRARQRHHDDLRDRAIVLLWLEAGSPRVAEMAALQLSDVSLRAGQEECTITHGKGDKVRTFPLSAVTADAVADYIRLGRPQRLRDRRDPGALWLTEKGIMTVSGLTQMLRRRAGRAGIGEVHPHIMRHTAFDIFDQNGGTAADAMALFGWSSEAMMRVYARRNANRRAIDRVRTMGQVDSLAA